MNRRDFLTSSAAGAVAVAAPSEARSRDPRPNFVIIFTDDQGYQDLGCYGAPLIKTPRIDRMSREGMRFTDFHVTAPVCTPSRSSLMTGCYAQRLGLAATPNPTDGKLTNLVLHSKSPVGLNPSEITVARLLKSQGYATACIGKWHLGHLPPFLPTRHGFDYYYGIPYSNDMKPSLLMRGETVIEQPVVQETLVERYTEEAVGFIREHRDEPFFLYVPHNMPHVPLHISERFRGKSASGLYGDVIEAIDWGVGRILNTLDHEGLARRTVVVFATDNGPWLPFGEHAGLAGPLRAGKGSTYEGGMRVPCIVRAPGIVPAGRTCTELATTMDILPTFARMAGTHAPIDRVIDGHDITPLLTGQRGASSPYDAFYHYCGQKLQAVRSGPWKLKLKTTLAQEDIYQRYDSPQAVIPEALYNLTTDPGEQKSVLKDHPDVAARLRAYAERARQDLGDEVLGTVGKGVRPVGRV